MLGSEAAFYPSDLFEKLFVMSNRLLSLSLVVATSVLLAGCYVPEKFATEIDVKPDGGYTFDFTGTIVNAMVAAHTASGKTLSEKDERELLAEAAKMRSSSGVKKATYEGAGRYDLEIQEHKAPGQPLDFMTMMRVRTRPDGVIVITASEVKDVDKREFAKIGMKINGQLSVQIPRNAEVVAHNADSTPTFGFGSYKWKIGGLDKRPMMEIRLKK